MKPVVYLIKTNRYTIKTNSQVLLTFKHGLAFRTNANHKGSRQSPGHGGNGAGFRFDSPPLAHPSEKSRNSLFLNGSFKKKSIKVWYSKAQVVLTGLRYEATRPMHGMPKLLRNRSGATLEP